MPKLVSVYHNQNLLQNLKKKRNDNLTYAHGLQ
jgi:hypothetical protein